MKQKPNGIDIILLVAVIVLVFGALYMTYNYEEEIATCHAEWQTYWEQSSCFNVDPTPYYVYSNSNDTHTTRPG